MIHSQFGKKFSSSSSISLLMKDLNEGLRKPDVIMLGGGNPAHIPEMDQYFQQLLIEMAKNGQLNEALSNYDGPQGKDALLEALANTLNEQVGWNISAKNIALTNGS
ncbi:Valine--pyruvate aminotransferase [Arsenophonus endosymbiont of Aleurodicus floccissimus]|nr:Valine--pyruvate aminotransferase [Arsenophonus endosymbiont of Aleurodicus floccissimus]